MDSHPAQIKTKPRLHECARLGVERLSGRAQHLVHDRRRGLRLRPAGGFLLSFCLSSSSSHSAHLRLSCSGAACDTGAGSGMRITVSATRFASRSSGSSTAPTTSFACRMRGRARVARQPPGRSHDRKRTAGRRRNPTPAAPALRPRGQGDVAPVPRTCARRSPSLRRVSFASGRSFEPAPQPSPLRTLLGGRKRGLADRPRRIADRFLAGRQRDVLKGRLAGRRLERGR